MNVNVAFPPAATGIPHVDAVLNEASAGPVPDRRTRLGRSSKRLNVADSLRNAGIIDTPQHGIEASNHMQIVIGLPGQGEEPGIAQVLLALANTNEQMNVRFTEMTNQMNNRFNAATNQTNARFTAMTNQMNARFTAMNNQINDRFTAINNQFSNVRARQMNSVASEPDDPIMVIRRDGEGNQLPPANLVYPATLHALNSLTPLQRRRLLQFYNQDPDPAATRLRRLKQHLGIRA